MPLRPVPILLVGAAFTASIFAAEPVAPLAGTLWPHEQGDLAPDPAILWGRLSNGLRYAVRSNAEPRGRISLCLLVEAGSHQEHANERGLAHFVEHMAFRGTRRFPAGTLVKTLQRHGMAIGDGVSAFTNLTSTYYLLNLASNSADNLDEGLRVLRDYADGIEFDPEEIRKERGVILSERRARESGAERNGWARFATVYGFTALPDRKPIGEVGVIEHADRAGLLGFYETWYRPERMIVIAVGDIGSGVLTAQIERQFGGLRARRSAAAEPDWGAARPEPGVHAALCTESEAGGGISTEIACILPGVLPPTRTALRTELARTVAFDILSMRLRAEIKKDPESFGGAGAQFQEAFHRFTDASVRIESRSTNWRRALATAEQELRRALTHGFYVSEVGLSTSTGLAAYRFSAEQAPTRASPALVQEILSDLTAGRVTQAPAAKLALVETILTSLTPEECLAAIRSLWPEDHRIIFVNGALELDHPAKEIAEIYELIRRVPLASADEEAPVVFAYGDLRPAGAVAERKHIDDLDIDLVQFANGVRLNLKKTAYEAGTVAVRMRFGSGLSAEPADRPGLGLVTSACFLGAGLGRHDYETIGRLLRGTTVNLQFAAEDDAFVFTGTTKTADLPRLLQLVMAYLTDPGWRQEGWTSAAGGLGSYYATVGNDTAALAQAVAPKLITNRDPRYGLPPFADISQRTFNEVREWLEPQLKDGPIEIGVTGDAEIESVVTLVSRTLGTLPAHSSRSTLHPRAVKAPARSASEALIIKSRTPKATVWMGWIAPPVEDATASRRAEMLAVILSDRIRVKIREELGATYDASAAAWFSQADPRFGFVFVQLTVPPAEARRLAELVKKISDGLAKGGVTADEFERARQPVIAGLEQHLRNNSYWLYYVLDKAQEHPERLEWPRTRNRDYAVMTGGEISALAQQCLGAKRAVALIVSPNL